MQHNVCYDALGFILHKFDNHLIIKTVHSTETESCSFCLKTFHLIVKKWVNHISYVDPPALQQEASL